MSKTILSQVDGFTPLPDLLIAKYGHITATVWGAAWRFCQMSDGVCRASMEKIAERSGISRQSAQKHMTILANDGFFEDMTPNLKNKPHIYRDTGKVSMYNRLGIGVNQIDSTVNEIDSHCQLDIHEDSIKERKEDRVKDASKKFSKGKTYGSVRGEVVDSANKTVDAILEQERQYQEKLAKHETWPHRDKFPEPIRELLDVYVKLTGQRPAKKDVTDWLLTGQDWLDVGIKGVDLENAYKQAKPENGKGFTVARPGSLTRTAGMFAGERRNNSGNAVSSYDKILAELEGNG